MSYRSTTSSRDYGRYERSRDSSRDKRSSRWSDRNSSRSNGSRSSGHYSSYSSRDSRSYGSHNKNEFGISFGQPGANLQTPDWSRTQLQPFTKNFYRQHQDITNLTQAEVHQWRLDNEVTVNGNNCPRPLRTFEQAGFPPEIMKELKRAGFTKPTSIQAQGWPIVLSGHDVIGIAETGSGKTLAFLLPGIVHILSQTYSTYKTSPSMLIIAPTRELAMQIKQETDRFSASTNIQNVAVYGGVPKRDQARLLRSGVQMIICTPGRLLDFLQSQTTNIQNVTYLVIDEADRLLDMGFEPQLRAIFSQIRSDRQMVMWSATWPKEVEALVSEFIKNNPLQVRIGSTDISANSRVVQQIEMVGSYEKQSRLYRILKENLIDNNKILIFLATRRMCDQLCRSLRGDGWPALAIHGDKPQQERDHVLRQFKSGKNPIMIATDVASRGIHVDDISLVINYDFPGNIEDYVHRIGRTGRAGKKGLSISFFGREDAKRARPLIKVLSQANQVIPPKLLEIAQTVLPERFRTRYRSKNSNNYSSGYNSGRRTSRFGNATSSQNYSARRNTTSSNGYSQPSATSYSRSTPAIYNGKASTSTSAYQNKSYTSVSNTQSTQHTPASSYSTTSSARTAQASNGQSTISPITSGMYTMPQQQYQQARTTVNAYYPVTGATATSSTARYMPY